MSESLGSILGKAVVAVAVAAVAVPCAVSLGDEANVVSFFDVYMGEGSLSAGPPYPSQPPILIGGYDGPDPAVALHFEDLLVCLDKLNPPETPGSIAAYDSGGGGGGGAVATLEISLELPGEPVPPESFFDVTFQAQDPGGGPVSIPDKPTVGFAESFFDVYFEVSLPDGAVASHTLHGEVNPAQPVGLLDVWIDHPPAESFFDVCFHLSVAGLPDPSQPLILAQMTGTYFPEPAGLALLALGGLAVVRRRRRT